MNELTVIASGLRFPEGPIAMQDGSIVLVEIERVVNELQERFSATLRN